MFDVRIISAGKLWIDGGCIFGPVPKSVWSQLIKPNDNNCICLVMNCLYVNTGSKKILIDTGIGNRLTPGERELYGYTDDDALVSNLNANEISPQQIDLVILTHLHFDHVGGCLRTRGDGTLVPTFPGAKLAVQTIEWQDATDPDPVLRASYDQDSVRLLQDHYEIHFLDGDGNLDDRISVHLSGGHTRGHQLVEIQGDTEKLLYVADICPTAHHVNPQWTMSYDQFPLTVKREKRRIFMERGDASIKYIFPHDPHVPCATVFTNPQGRLEFQPATI